MPYQLSFGQYRTQRHINVGTDPSLDVRRSGPEALDLCNIAAGRAELFFELMLSPWDYAAGALIVEEAGGIVTARTRAFRERTSPDTAVPPCTPGRDRNKAIPRIGRFYVRAPCRRRSADGFPRSGTSTRTAAVRRRIESAEDFHPPTRAVRARRSWAGTAHPCLPKIF